MEEALAGRLLQSPQVADLAGTRIAWNLLPQAVDLPAVALHLISFVPVQADEGDCGLAMARVQIDCWAEDRQGENGGTIAIRLARAVRSALSDVSMVAGSTTFQGVFLDDMREDAERGADGKVRYRRSIDFEFWPEL